MLGQEVKIQGSDLEIQRKDRGRSVRYFVPILSLGPVQVNSVPNPFGTLMVIWEWGFYSRLGSLAAPWAETSS